MKSKSLIFFVLLLVSAAGRSLSAADTEKKYFDANLAYQNLEFEKSIQLYEELINDKNYSADVYYNLGNAYFKNGNFAKAILNYERALKLAPDDEDIAFNLKIASLKAADKMESVPEVFYKKWITNLATLFSSKTWTVILITNIWLLFLFASLYALGRSVGVKKFAFLLCLIFLISGSLTAIIAAKSHRMTYVDEKAIILSTSVYVKSSPDEKGNDLFILHEGTKVEILDKLNNWLKIRITNGSVGWMKSGDLEKI